MATKQYDAIIVQPIFGPQLIPLVKQAIKDGIKVVNVDQILGTNPGTAEATGSRNVRQRRLHPDADRQEAGRARPRSLQGEEPQPLQRRLPLLGEGVLARHGDPEGLRQRDQGEPSIKVVAEGETFYQHPVALKAAQTMLRHGPTST